MIDCAIILCSVLISKKNPFYCIFETFQSSFLKNIHFCLVLILLDAELLSRIVYNGFV